MYDNLHNTRVTVFVPHTQCWYVYSKDNITVLYKPYQCFYIRRHIPILYTPRHVTRRIVISHTHRLCYILNSHTNTQHSTHTYKHRGITYCYHGAQRSYAQCYDILRLHHYTVLSYLRIYHWPSTLRIRY